MWHTVVAEVRHAAVHSNMLLKHTRTRSWGHAHVALLEAAFGTVSEPRGYVLHPERKHAQEALTLFAEYGYAVFKELTQLAGYPPKVLPES